MAIEVESAHPPAGQPWQVPFGWSAAGTAGRQDFFVGSDRVRRHSGSASLLLQSRVPNPSGNAAVYQSFAAGRFRGRRVRFSAYLQNARIADRGSFWLAVRGDESAGLPGNEVVTVTGTHLWDLAIIVVDIPADALQIGFGVSLQGRGALWADDFRVEEVSRFVPLTAARHPRNLDFTETKNVLKEN
jgi:hypothetical protein